MATTATSDVTWDQGAWEQKAYFPLRANTFWDTLATVKATNETHTGASITFNIPTELASASSSLTELTDVTPATMADSTVTVTLAEKGNAVKTSAKLRGTSYLPVDPIIANLIGYNAALSIDDVVLAAVDSGITNVRLAGGVAGVTSIATSNVVAGTELGYMAAKLAGNNAAPFMDGAYMGLIHPDAAYDLKEATSGNTWQEAEKYTMDGQGRVYNNRIGRYKRANWLETTRVTVDTNASNGSGSTGNIDVYRTYMLGSEAIAKAFSKAPGYGPQPRMVVAPVTDVLRRFTGLGWYHLVGYSVFRAAACYVLKSASSIGSNAS